MKVALILQRDFPAWHLRRGLITTLIKRGIEVVVVSPDGPFVPMIRGLGARHIAVPMRRSMSPLKDVATIWRLYRVFIVEKPDIVHTMNAKPNIYGTLAARAAGVPKVIGLVAGLGYGFIEDGSLKRNIAKRVYTTLYWIANNFIDRVSFQNRDDLDLFVAKRMIRPDKTVLIRGSGVDLEYFSPDNVDKETVEQLRAQLKIDRSIPVVLMLSRLTWSKGVKVFFEAAKQAERSGLDIKFLLAGPLASEESDAIPENYVRSSLAPNLVWAEGFREDVRELLHLSDVVVAPCIYREGLPRILLEALSMGKPLVASDQVGCREPVDHGKNGFLIPPSDSLALASAIDTILRDATLYASFSQHSRAKAEAEFDEVSVVNRTLAELYEI